MRRTASRYLEELSRCADTSATPAATSASPPLDVRDDVRLRVHLPMVPVGVAQVEAVWADGPCNNMTAAGGVVRAS